MSKQARNEYDLVIVGSGIAGLSFALKVSEAGYRVAIFTKKDKAESNTNYAQGGIAAVTSAKDDLDKHVEDTLEAGDGLLRTGDRPGNPAGWTRQNSGSRRDGGFFFEPR